MSGSNCGRLESNETPKKSTIESSIAIVPPWIPCGIAMSKSSIPKFTTRLTAIATLAASALARFQLKPIATAGTSAAAKVPQPKAPSSATRRAFT